MSLTRTRTGHVAYKDRKGQAASEEWQLDWYGRTPEVKATAEKGPAAHFSIKEAGLNTAMPGTSGARDRQANPKGKRIT